MVVNTATATACWAAKKTGDFASSKTPLMTTITNKHWELMFFGVQSTQLFGPINWHKHLTRTSLAIHSVGTNYKLVLEMMFFRGESTQLSAPTTGTNTSPGPLLLSTSALPPPTHHAGRGDTRGSELLP